MFNLQLFASADYWRKREERNLKSNLKKEAEYDKEIERIYKDMLDATQKEIDAFYGKYADAEGITLAEAKKRVSQLEIEAYERKAKKYVEAASQDRANTGKTNKRAFYFSKRANEEMRLYNLTMKVNRLEMLKANIGLELIKGHAELETFMSEILRGRTEAELERQAGILGKTIRGNAKLANSIVNASFKNATFSDRIWMYHDQMKSDLSKLLQSGMIQGKNSRQLAKDLRKYYYGPEYLKNGKKGAVYNTERLMRTELARVQTEAQRQSFERNGFTEYTFLALADCCDICAAINGKHFKVKDMMPGENAPPLHPHCRCSTSAYEDSKEYEAWLDYLSQGGSTAEWEKSGKAEWKKTGTVMPKANKAKEPSFTPAKTIEDAEKFAEKFVNPGGFSIGKNNISFKGLSLEQANTINKTLNNIFSKYNIGKFDSIETFGKAQKKYWSKHSEAPMATSNFGNIMLNKEICKNPKTISKYIEDGRSSYNYVIDNIERLSGADRKLAETYRQAGRSLVGDSFEDMILHETGHHLSYMTDYNNDISKVIKKNGWENYAKNISGYANHSAGEYIAESWVAFNKGETKNLDPELVKIFERLRK